MITIEAGCDGGGGADRESGGRVTSGEGVHLSDIAGSLV